jgi:PAS domain S-box-containing protein
MNDSDTSALRDTILDSIANGVFTVDDQWRITSFNRAAEGITGVKRGDALGQPCCEVFRASICETTCALQRTLAQVKTPDRLDLQEIDDGQIEQYQQEDASDQPQTDRCHKNALCCHYTDNQEIEQRTRKQPAAGQAAPEMPPLAHQVNSRLPIKDQHNEDQCLQLGKGKLELIACPEEDTE